MRDDLIFNLVYFMLIVNMTWMCNNLQQREIDQIVLQDYSYNGFQVLCDTSLPIYRNALFLKKTLEGFKKEKYVMLTLSPLDRWKIRCTLNDSRVLDYCKNRVVFVQ